MVCSVSSVIDNCWMLETSLYCCWVYFISAVRNFTVSVSNNFECKNICVQLLHMTVGSRIGSIQGKQGEKKKTVKWMLQTNIKQNSHLNFENLISFSLLVALRCYYFCIDFCCFIVWMYTFCRTQLFFGLLCFLCIVTVIEGKLKSTNLWYCVIDYYIVIVTVNCPYFLINRQRLYKQIDIHIRTRQHNTIQSK